MFKPGDAVTTMVDMELATYPPVPAGTFGILQWVDPNRLIAKVCFVGRLPDFDVPVDLLQGADPATYKNMWDSLRDRLQTVTDRGSLESLSTSSGVRMGFTQVLSHMELLESRANDS